jgi:hypothetical protein
MKPNDFDTSLNKSASSGGGGGGGIVCLNV